MRTSLVIATLGSIALFPALAHGQPASAPPAPAPLQAPPSEGAFAHHQGVMVGFGLGVSLVTCDGCDTNTGFGLDFNLGGFLTPRVALMYDSAVWVDSEDDAALALGTNTVAVQYWAAPRFWLKAGIGLATAQLSVNGRSDSETGRGITGALGYELPNTGGFNIDVSTRLSAVTFDGDSLTLVHVLVGFRWK